MNIATYYWRCTHNKLCPHCVVRMNTADGLALTICNLNNDCRLNLPNMFVGMEPCEADDWKTCILNPGEAAHD